MKPGVLFDLDGVLLDSMPWHVKAWQEAFRALGLEVPEEAIYLHEGAIELDTARKLFEDQGVNPTPEFFREAFRLQKKIFTEKYRKRVKPFPGVEEALRELKREGRRLALVTSSHREILEEVLPGGFLGFFDFVVTGDQVSRRKPHPDPYLTGLSGLRMNREEALAVENAPAGIRAAKGAGLLCVAITTTLPPEHLKEADLIVENHERLFGILRNGRI
ncbi:HAD family phosphatase [Thermosulfurimonas sp. F29]|uniref:HAD family hydrolase n=1 Tax=Thermosulfurimonas sp. F29 TaxID=2867247 RepID=UPI001C83FBC4|nr:HAD family phosphatase [Thermosulfurimonas sp. F29]MBX6422973.1 HAD family phosphatase [Thermosulfurimonas sp. F29]